MMSDIFSIYLLKRFDCTPTVISQVWIIIFLLQFLQSEITARRESLKEKKKYLNEFLFTIDTAVSKVQVCFFLLKYYSNNSQLI